MASLTSVPSSTPIAQLNPVLEQDESSITGIITLIWPYASSKETLSLLLVEPDFRLRSNRGQVRVHFQGSSAKAVARSGISSGDQLLLSLRGAQWAKASTAAATPGRGIDWELHFGERLVLQIQRPLQQPISLDIDHPTPSPEPSVQTSTPARSPPHIHLATSIGRPQFNAQVWASPAFLKRSYSFAAKYDPFAVEEFPDNGRRKRTKFGRDSGQWRFAERTPSPEKEPEILTLEVVSPSRLLDQGKAKREDIRSHAQQAHGTRSHSKAASEATSASNDRSELEVPSEDGVTAKEKTVEVREEKSRSLSEVNGGRQMMHEITKNEINGNFTTDAPRTPHAKPDPNVIDVLEERGEVDSRIARPTSPTSKTEHVDDEGSQEPVQIAQASPSVLVEISSSASSSSAPESDQEPEEESDQESDDESHQDSDSLFDEEFEFEQSNAAIYSGPTSDYGLDGSAFSRPPPAAEFAPPPSVIKRLEDGLEFDILNTDDAQDILPLLKSDVEQIDSEAEESSISMVSAAESLFSDKKEPTKNIGMFEGHDAAQRRSNLQMSSSDELGSPEIGESDDEASKDPAAANVLADEVDVFEDDNSAKRSSSSPPSSSNQFNFQQTQDEPGLRIQDSLENEAALNITLQKSLNDFPKEHSPSSVRGKTDLSEASDKEDTPETSPQKHPADPVMPQESPNSRQQDMVLDVRLSREESKIASAQGHDRTEDFGMLTSRVQQTTVEIIDLESDDEDNSIETSQALVDKKDPEFAQTNEVSPPDETQILISDAGNGHQESISEAYLPSNLPTSTGLALEPVAAVEVFPPMDVFLEPEIHEEAFELEGQASHKQSPVPKTQGSDEELPFVGAAPLKQSLEVKPEVRERKLRVEKEPRHKQSPTAEIEPSPRLIDELPSTLPDSFEDTRSKSQLLTPSATQRTDFAPQPSAVSLDSALEDDTLPTPRLTQGTSAGIVLSEMLAPPEEPTLKEISAPLKKTSAFIEKLKEMRRLSSQSPKPRSSDASVLDPWFAPKRLSQIVPDSEGESEAESSPERDKSAEIPTIIGRELPQTPEKPLAKSFIRSPPQRNHLSSIHSSPQYLPPSQPPPPGFRTNLSYFVPLATLPSHFATNVDILAIALYSTPVTRATSGPRDYNQTLYITDPSSSAEKQESITTAQIFRPNNRCFPLVDKGDALLLRDFKVQSFQKHLTLLSTESSAWAVFRKGTDVQMRGPPVEFGAEERAFARGLWDWWASLSDDARQKFEDAVPEYKKSDGMAKITNSKAGGNKSDARFKKEEIEGLGVDLPGSQGERTELIKERSLAADGVQERDTVRESIEAPKRVLRARGAKGVHGRSESTRDSRFGTMFTGGLGEPDETQGSAHELRDGKAYKDKRAKHA